MRRAGGSSVTSFLGGFGVLVCVIGLFLPAPAGAQEWKIYVVGRTEPILADYYQEEAPWVFFHFVENRIEDRSSYVFAVACTRISRVERGGAPLPAPPCPVDRLKTSMPQIYRRVMEPEQRRVDDLIARLREQNRAYAEAILGSVLAARGMQATGQASGGQELLQANIQGINFMAQQINDTLFDIRLTNLKISSLEAAATEEEKLAPGARPRYFFFTR
jgi:hypothetical protein